MAGRGSAPPSGWRHVRAGPVVLEARADLEGPARAAGLLDAVRVESLLAGSADASRAAEVGATGRGRTVVLSLPGAAPRLILRPLRHGGVLGPLLGHRYLGLGRPRREVAATARLREAGAPVPAPALVIGLAAAWPFWRALVGTELEEGAQDAVAFLAEPPSPARLLRAAGAAGRALRRFHDAGGVHPDLHVKNLLVRESGDGAEVIVIDLDRARVSAPVSARERMTELMRLLRSLHKRALVEAVGARGIARFFAAYTAGDRTLRRALLAHRGREERRIVRHARLWRTPLAGGGAPQS